MQIFKEKIKITTENIAAGGFGKVHSGVYLEKNKNIAIKEYNNDTIIDEIKLELSNLEKINKRYPFIIHCIGFFAEIKSEVILDTL
jgi:hypothetical protein